jgi:hypothetical protein
LCEGRRSNFEIEDMQDKQQKPLSANGELALMYAGSGIPVFPCVASGPNRKRPMTVNGYKDATTDLEKVRNWWTAWPEALVGIPTGSESGVWVLDVDGELGKRSLAVWLTHVGLTIADLTGCVGKTPGGGYHFIFRLQPGERPRNRAKDIGPGLDTRGVKADGTSAGYFIAPGSALPDGMAYKLIDPTTINLNGDVA